MVVVPDGCLAHFRKEQDFSFSAMSLKFHAILNKKPNSLIPLVVSKCIWEIE